MTETDELYVYSACCTWHGPISETKPIHSTIELNGHRIDTEMPGCPYCASPLMQFNNRAEWDANVSKFAAKHPEVPHYSRWIQSLNSPCMPVNGWDWRAAYAEWVRTWKDGLELNYWTMAANLEEHRARLSMYLWAWGFYGLPRAALEIGCGPLGGFLPLLRQTKRRVAVDPLCEEYFKAGLLVDKGTTFETWADLETKTGIEFVSKRFEDFETTERFDAIFAADSLDHGDMSFHLLPKIAGLLAPGGMFYLHVHLRKPDQLNETHDHALTVEQLDGWLKEAAAAGVELQQLRRDIYFSDVTGEFPLTALVGVWGRK